MTFRFIFNRQNFHFLIVYFRLSLHLKPRELIIMFPNILSFGNTSGVLYKYFNYRHEKSLKLILASFVSQTYSHSHSLSSEPVHNKFISLFFPTGCSICCENHLLTKLIPDFYTFLDLKSGNFSPLRGGKMASFSNINWLHNLIWHTVCFINERN